MDGSFGGAPMMHRTVGTVQEILATRDGIQELVVAVETEDGEVVLRRAVNITDLVPAIDVEDRVLLNTTAVELGLGTGGVDYVVASPDITRVDGPCPGHIMKARYTPVQVPVLAVEAPESPHHEALTDFDSLDDLPIVCAELMSQVPVICAAFRWAAEYSGFGRIPSLALVMTDGGAMPLAISKLAAQMKQSGLVDVTITAGQAFGGDLEAINVYSALAAAYIVANADMVVVCQGPGNAGTGTPLGFSGVQQGEAINAAVALGGLAIAVPRISFADSRPRHRAVSHHTITVLQRIALAEALIPIPRLPDEYADQVNTILEQTGISDKHQPVVVDADEGLDYLSRYGIEVTSMGRSVNDDRPFFLAAAAAGILAAQVAETREIARGVNSSGPEES